MRCEHYFLIGTVDLQHNYYSHSELFSISTVWDYDHRKEDDFIGYVEISVQDLFAKYASNELIPLKPPPKPHKQDAGSLRVLSITHYNPSTTEGKASTPQPISPIL
jgi:hypothetical protein